MELSELCHELRECESAVEGFALHKCNEQLRQGRWMFDLPLQVNFSMQRSVEVERALEYDDDASEEFRLGIEAAVSDSLKRLAARIKTCPT